MLNSYDLEHGCPPPAEINVVRQGGIEAMKQ